MIAFYEHLVEGAWKKVGVCSFVGSNCSHGMNRFENIDFPDWYVGPSARWTDFEGRVLPVERRDGRTVVDCRLYNNPPEEGPVDPSPVLGQGSTVATPEPSETTRALQSTWARMANNTINEYLRARREDIERTLTRRTT
jgi:hypothetical protein